MSHGDEYEAIDKQANRRAIAALASQNAPYTIADLCHAISYPLPVSEDDLRSLVRICQTWGIRTNMDTEPVWIALTVVQPGTA